MVVNRIELQYVDMFRWIHEIIFDTKNYGTRERFVF